MLVARLPRCWLRPSTSLLCRSFSSHPPPPPNPDGSRDITNMDILRERAKKRAQTREEMIGGQKVQWIYRSEMVDALGLDRSHRNIWISFAVIIILGFGAFVWVKSQVILSRKEEMEEREKIRRSLKLSGDGRKKIGIVSD